jgi:hypothetical protein
MLPTHTKRKVRAFLNYRHIDRHSILQKVFNFNLKFSAWVNKHRIVKLNWFIPKSCFLFRESKFLIDLSLKQTRLINQILCIFFSQWRVDLYKLLTCLLRSQNGQIIKPIPKTNHKIKIRKIESAKFSWCFGFLGPRKDTVGFMHHTFGEVCLAFKLDVSWRPPKC